MYIQQVFLSLVRPPSACLPCTRKLNTVMLTQVCAGMFLIEVDFFVIYNTLRKLPDLKSHRYLVDQWLTDAFLLFLWKHRVLLLLHRTSSYIS